MIDTLQGLCPLTPLEQSPQIPSNNIGPSVKCLGQYCFLAAAYGQYCTQESNMQ